MLASPFTGMSTAPVLIPSPRLTSLDAFRGATIAAMLLVNNAGDWNHVYPPLLHAKWHGWTPTDLVFPFFLWIVGVSMTFSFARRMARGDGRRAILLHVLRRSALIFAVGLFLNAFPAFDFEHLRIPGVLQRIALCYLAAGAIVLYTDIKGQIGAAIALLAGYWALMTLVPVPGYGAGVLEPEGNFAQWVDRLFLEGHMYAATRTWDPEGFVSTLPAIATTLFGIFAGHLLRSELRVAEKSAWLFTGGGVLLLAGLMLDPLLPINKNLWTSTYSMFTAGMAALLFSGCYWLIDGNGFKRFARPFVIYGLNPIVIYTLSGIVGDLLSVTGIGKALYRNVFLPVASPVNASLLYALSHVAFFFLVAWLLYRRNWIIRL